MVSNYTATPIPLSSHYNYTLFFPRGKRWNFIETKEVTITKMQKELNNCSHSQIKNAKHQFSTPDVFYIS